MKQEILAEFLLAQTGLEDIMPENEFCKIIATGIKPTRKTKKLAGKKRRRPQHQSDNANREKNENENKDEDGDEDEDKILKENIKKHQKKRKKTNDEMVEVGSGSETDREDMTEIETEAEHPDETEDEREHSTESESESESEKSEDDSEDNKFTIRSRKVYRQLLNTDTKRRAETLAAIETFCTAPLVEDPPLPMTSIPVPTKKTKGSLTDPAVTSAASAETLEKAPDIMARALVAVLEQRITELVKDTAERASAAKEIVQDVDSIAASVKRARSNASAQGNPIGSIGSGSRLVNFVNETTEQVRELREELARARNLQNASKSSQ
ncbi:uncharacterized protein SAPINGB_P006356 [Magnusiomyces paraingens]|uniref:Uncharacterized protein n=1 Tax=Magnusiomyces paraingens TaxID=2606893 RepID=A0A5E8C5Q1_9ASCO|nr:uncharacterized protein SAPINGB_P006356 [Saprochaete ingens]VVT58732.1 unnamed protein product [Saprochaete ingens]